MSAASRSYRCLSRTVIFSLGDLLSHVEPMGYVGVDAESAPDDRHTDDECDVRISVAGQRYRRHGLRGVPARLIDLALPEQMPTGPFWLEIGERLGRFDGAVRDRLCVRPVPDSVLRRQPIQLGTLRTERTDVQITLTLLYHDRTAWQRSYAVLRSTLDPDGPQRILMWHYTRYYTHLRTHLADVTALSESWRPSEGADLNRANREASQALYALSRQYGWRKLTLRERERYGLPADSPQWVTDEQLVRLLKGPQKGPDYYASLTPAALADGWEVR